MSGSRNQSSLGLAKSQKNYLFDGDFRRRPNQNLSGASRSLDRVQLLQQAALQRQSREDGRRREQSSQIIQSFWRGYRCRQSLRVLMRDKFDQFISTRIQTNYDHLDERQLTEITHEFVLLYHSQVDAERFPIIIDLLMSKKSLVKKARVQFSGWLFRIIRLLKMSLEQLSKHPDPINSKYLKFLESFTSHDIIDRLEAETLWTTLSQAQLYIILRKIVEDQPEPSSLTVEAKETTRILVEIIRRSIDFEVESTKMLENNSVRSFLVEFLRGPLNDYLRNHFLPMIIFLKPDGLKPRSVLTCFDKPQDFIPKYFDRLEITDSESSLDRVQKCVNAVWLSLVFVKTIHGHIEKLCDEDKTKYLSILSIFVHPAEYLLNLNSILNSDDGHVSDSQDDVMEDIIPQQDFDPIKVTLKGVKKIITELVVLINDQSHVTGLKSILFGNEMHSYIQAAIIKICNFTLSHEQLAIFECPLLYTVAFNCEFHRKLWRSIMSAGSASLFGQNIPIHAQICKGDINISQESWELVLPRLRLFCSLYSYLLPTLDDEEFYSNEQKNILKTNQGPLSENRMTFFVDKELIGISSVLRDISVGLIDIIYNENKGTYHQLVDFAHNSANLSNPRSEMLAFNIRSCFQAMVRLVCQIHARDSRKQFCPQGHWICPSAVVPINKANDFCRITSQHGRLIEQLTKIDPMDKSSTPPSDFKAILILQELPFVTPFQDRVQMFHQFITKEKRIHISEGYHFGLPESFIQVQIRRNYIYEDAFRKLSDGNVPNMRLPLRVSLINAVGADEAGIDGGGLSKEFLSELLKAGFDPMRGFFKSTKDHELYPNPSAKVLFSSLAEGYEIHYEFLGKMLGKALFEKVMVELPFAGFFLAKILARHSPSAVDWHNLASLDPILYKNLVYLKNYKGDVADLNLDFTITNNELGEREIVELKPGGSTIPVTKTNKVEYVHLVADYRLNKQMRTQCAAFMRGLCQIIDLDWLRMFDPRELQILISGAQTQIDIDDWMRNTVYGNGYSDDSEVIATFWRVARDLDEAHKRKLLRFATSCSNPPLLGFRDLHPQFTIVPSEGTRLPTASTCMNLLKLPECKDEDVMKSKLLYAIDSNSGFELS